MHKPSHIVNIEIANHKGANAVVSVLLQFTSESFNADNTAAGGSIPSNDKHGTTSCVHCNRNSLSILASFKWCDLLLEALLHKDSYTTKSVVTVPEDY